MIADEAVFVGPRRVRLRGADRELTARRVLLAVGSEPALPPVDGLERAAPLTTDTVWALDALPERLVVLGGGPVGCELGQAFARLGSRVTIVEHAPRLLPREDPEVGDLLARRFTAEGIDVRTSGLAPSGSPRTTHQPAHRRGATAPPRRRESLSAAAPTTHWRDGRRPLVLQRRAGALQVPAQT